MSNEKEISIMTIAAILLLLVIAGIGYAIFKKHDGRIAGSNSNNEATSKSAASPPDRDANGCYTPNTVRRHYGENACVDYTVGYVYETSAGTQFLDEKSDYADGFVGYIPYNAEHLDINSLEGKNIKVTGQIQEYNGYPEIVISSASQVGIYQ